MNSCHSDGFEVNSDEEEMEPGDPTNLNSPFLAMPDYLFCHTQIVW